MSHVGLMSAHVDHIPIMSCMSQAVHEHTGVLDLAHAYPEVSNMTWQIDDPFWKRRVPSPKRRLITFLLLTFDERANCLAP